MTTCMHHCRAVFGLDPCVAILSPRGLRTRTHPEAAIAGLMWHEREGRVDGLRHECREGDGVGPYGWLEHDGVSYGKQELADQKAGVRIITSMVKPAHLEDADKLGGAASLGEWDGHAVFAPVS